MSVGDLTEEYGEEYFGDWISIEGPTHVDTQSGAVSINNIRVMLFGEGEGMAAKRFDGRTRKMMESIAEFVRQHQADW